MLRKGIQNCMTFLFMKSLWRYFVVNIINIWGLSLEPPFPLWVIIKISNKPHVNYGFTIFTFDFCIIFQTLFIVCNNAFVHEMSVLCFSAVGVFALNMRNFHDYRILNVYWTVIQLYIGTVYSFIAVIIKLWLAWVSTNYRGFMNLLFFSYRW